MTFESATIPRDRLLPGIHGLRGIAALSIFLYHLVHVGGIAVPGPFAFIAAEFGKAVHLFFVLSAFSLLHSTEHTMQRPGWVAEYLVKRYFRIAPLYYAVMVLMIMRPIIHSGRSVYDVETTLLNVSFLFGLAPWTGIVWAGWSVGVEMLFYIVLPIVLLTVRSSAGTLLLTAVSIGVSAAAYIELNAHYAHTATLYGYNWAHFSFASNLCFFAMGIYAFRIAHDLNWTSPAVQRGVPAFCMLLIGMLVIVSSRGKLAVPWANILWGVVFASLCVWQGAKPARLIANRVLEFAGERSYSIYLLHPIIIFVLRDPIRLVYDSSAPLLGAYAYFVAAIFVLAVLLCVSELSYRFIEIPGITLGRKLIHRMRAAAPEGRGR